MSTGARYETPTVSGVNDAGRMSYGWPIVLGAAWIETSATHVVAFLGKLDEFSSRRSGSVIWYLFRFLS